MAVNSLVGRLAREQRTIDAMIAIYCRDHHGRRRGLCAECEGLRRYAEQRLIHCPFEDDKPTCVNCKVHCYRAEMREAVRVVMRDAGPRMLLRHPILAIRHLWFDSKREAPDRPRRKASPAA
jgi:hypothetical protein